MKEPAIRDWLKDKGSPESDIQSVADAAVGGNGRLRGFPLSVAYHASFPFVFAKPRIIPFRVG